MLWGPHLLYSPFFKHLQLHILYSELLWWFLLYVPLYNIYVDFVSCYPVQNICHVSKNATLLVRMWKWGSPISKNKSSRVSATTPLQLISEEIQFPKLLFAFFSTRLWTKFRTVIMLRFIYLTNFETEGKYRKWKHLNTRVFLDLFRIKYDSNHLKIR